MMPDLPNITVNQGWITPKQAKEILEKHCFEGQRKHRIRHSTALANVMKKGLFRNATNIEFAHLPDGQILLVDAYHRLHAMIKSNTQQFFNIVNHNCKNMAEVKALYAKFDRGLRRTPTDMMNAYGLREELGISWEEYMCMYGACGLATYGFLGDLETSYRQILFPDLNNSEARAAMVLEWKEEAEALCEDLKGAEKILQRYILRVGILAVALVTYRYAPEKAHEFWNGMAQDDGLLRNDPRKAFIYFMGGNAVRGARHHHLSRTVAKTWNAWTGRTSQAKVHLAKQSSPINLRLTPHNGRKHMLYIDREGTLLKDPIPLEKAVSLSKEALEQLSA